MKKKLPGIIFLLAMPCSVLLFVQVEKWSGSELVALLSAVLFYVVVAVILGFVFRSEEPEKKQPCEISHAAVCRMAYCFHRVLFQHRAGLGAEGQHRALQLCFALQGIDRDPRGNLSKGVIRCFRQIHGQGMIRRIVEYALCAAFQ